jgi:hypothetical protein
MSIVTATPRSPQVPWSLLPRMFALLFAIAAAVALSSCGGGGSGSPAPDTTAASPVLPPPPLSGNVLPITVDRGTNGASVNVPFVSVVVCEPGTDNCRTVDHVLVDTASSGLRLTPSALAGLSLPVVTNAAGAAVGECAQFATGHAWGSVRRADIRLAGERANGAPVQIASDPDALFATVPDACSRTGAQISLGAGSNGILGVGMLSRDCGGACASSTAPGLYYGCVPAGCTATTLPLTSQVANPVSLFAADNNGVAIALPAVPIGGVPILSGSLIFGIDTQSNNPLGAATVFKVNGAGNFTTTYKGQIFTSSFIDSGSNAIFFADASLPVCSGFYCPAAPLTLSAVNTSAAGVTGNVDFVVESLPSVSSAAAAHLAGDIGLARSFDWGLPFFFGRTVFVAMSGASTSKGAGPFWAY